jgi:2-phospho-L-lactate guanylyltransferase (CobY/MobA/RfbA family)
VLIAVPLRSFETGFERLAASLGQRRIEFAEAVAAHVVGACRRAGIEPFVVGSGDDVTGWCEDLGLGRIDDPGEGHDAAARAAIDRAGGEPWAVAHGDLALLDHSDVTAVREAAASGMVLAPSRDGGTNMIAGRGPFRLSYGPGSFHRHLASAGGGRVLVRTGTLIEIDTPGDLIAAARLRGGEWLAPFLTSGP